MSTPYEVAADFAGLAAAARVRVHAVVVSFGAQLQTKAMANASGRPGPNAITGNMRRSINRRTTQTVSASTSMIGSSAPQARRHELGFSGEDSLGRSYDQKAYPYLGPALDDVSEPFAAAVGVAGLPPRGSR